MKLKNLSRQFWVFCLALLWFLPSQAQSPNLVTGGLFAHYPFDGTPEDVSGNGNHATLNGSPAYVDGYRGRGVRLDNSTALYGASRGQLHFPERFGEGVRELQRIAQPRHRGNGEHNGPSPLLRRSS